MRKYIAILLCLLLTAGLLSGCGGSKNPAAEDSRLKIVTTIFPEYDWVSAILGDNPAGAELTLLLGNGVDLHSFQPTADDMIRVSSCDLLVYLGGASDQWIEDARQEAVNKDMAAVALLSVLGDAVREEDLVEGMEPEAEEEEAEDGPEYDEHVWLSVRHAATACRAIAAQLCALDPDNRETYTANLNAYLEKLSALDGEYQSAVVAGRVKTLLFGDRFPFRYLADDYGLTYYAAFPGCSAETEASFETVTFLAGRCDALDLHSVLTIEGAEHRIAETIVSNTKTKDQTVLTMDSMQAVTDADVENGESYLSVMERNLDVLRQALQ